MRVGQAGMLGCPELVDLARLGAYGTSRTR